MPHRSEQPWVHEDRVQEAVAVHGLDHRIHDPANPLLVCRAGTFFLYCRIVAITHLLQLIRIEEPTKIHVTIAVEGFLLCTGQNVVVLISETKPIHRIFDFGERQSIERPT